MSSLTTNYFSSTFTRLRLRTVCRSLCALRRCTTDCRQFVMWLRCITQLNKYFVNNILRVTRLCYWYGIGLRGFEPWLGVTAYWPWASYLHLYLCHHKVEFGASRGAVMSFGNRGKQWQPTAWFMTKSSAGWLPRDRDQLQTRRSLIECGTSAFILTTYCCSLTPTTTSTINKSTQSNLGKGRVASHMYAVNSQLVTMTRS